MGVFEVPAPDGSPSTKPTTTGYADGAFGVSARSDAQDAGKELVKWMSTKEFGQLVADKVKQLSAVPGRHLRRPAAEADGRQLRQEPHADLLLVDFRYGTPSGTDVLGTGLQELLLGKKSATAVSDELQTGVSQWFKPSA